jgi:hypothetical protein
MITKSIKTWKKDRDNIIAENAIDCHVFCLSLLQNFVPYREVENFGKAFDLAIW